MERLQVPMLDEEERVRTHPTRPRRERSPVGDVERRVIMSKIAFIKERQQGGADIRRKYKHEQQQQQQHNIK